MRDLISLKEGLEVLDVLLIPVTLALLVPWITRRWQHKQRESQIKVELVAAISELVMSTVMTVFVFQTKHKTTTGKNDTQEEELNRVYQKWRVDTCVIGSKLHAYFPDKSQGDSQIHRKWHRFSDQLTEYYERQMDTGAGGDPKQLEAEKNVLFNTKAMIIEEVLRARITGFRGGAG